MKKSTLFTIIIGASVITGAAVAIPYFAKQSLLQRIEPLRPLMSEQSKRTHQTQVHPSLFSTHIAFSSNDKKATYYLSDEVVLDLTVAHPFSTWFSDEPLPLQGTLEFKGNLFELLRTENNASTAKIPFTGSLQKNGDLIFELQTPKGSVTTPRDLTNPSSETVLSTLSAAPWKLHLSPSADTFTAKGNYPLFEQYVSANGKPELLSSWNNTSVDFTQKLSDSLQGSLKIHTQKMSFPALSSQLGGAPAFLEDVKTGTSIALKEHQGKSGYDAEFYFHIDKSSPLPIINSLGMQWEMSVRQMDASLLRSFIQQIEKQMSTQSTNTQAPTELLDSKTLRNYFDQFSLKGISFNLDKLRVFDQSNNALQAAARLSLAPVAKPEQLSLEDNLSFQLALNAQGPLLKLVESNLPQLAALGIQNVQIVPKNGIPYLEISVLLTKNQFLVNQLPVGPNLMESVHTPWVQNLRKSDIELGWQNRPLIQLELPTEPPNAALPQISR